MAFVREKLLKQSFGSVATGIELKPGANGKHPGSLFKMLAHGFAACQTRWAASL